MIFLYIWPLSLRILRTNLLMIVEKQFVKSFIALLLTFALMLPVVIQFSHNYESHQHTVCNNEQSTHYHKAAPDCSTCDFHIQSFNFDIISYTEIVEIYNTKEVKNNFNALVHSIKINTLQLRGPPSILN